jgi:hypothetical protein
LFASSQHGEGERGENLPVALLGAGAIFKNDLPTSIDLTGRSLRDLYYTVLTNWFELPVESFGNHYADEPNVIMPEVLV